jgi:hypothetical protein
VDDDFAADQAGHGAERRTGVPRRLKIHVRLGAFSQVTAHRALEPAHEHAETVSARRFNSSQEPALGVGVLPQAL